jgi:uncharacterized membrane protein
MEGLVVLLVLLAVAALVCGPIALMASFLALARLREMQRELHEMRVVPAAERRAAVRSRLTRVLPTEGGVGPEATVEPVPVPADRVPPQVPAPAGGSDGLTHPEAAPEAATAAPSVAVGTGGPPIPDTACNAPGPAAARTPGDAAGLEQQIGTRWVLVAGVVTVIFAVGFFLKYAYDNQWIGPLGRVVIAGFGGLLALVVGELTRRRGYDIVAKGVTALGFAILYAAVFAAHRWYHLLGTAPAYVLASGITVAALSYAFVLDEVLIALLSLVGGYLTPVVLATGRNQPNLLFGYVLILSAGALLCAYRRGWRTVSILAFVGTYLLYTGWFERFYRPAQRDRPTDQLGVALVWLSVFFVIYLLVPLVHTLLRRVRSRTQDAVLVLADGGVVFYYLWTMLGRRPEHELALASLLMGGAYLGLTGLALRRCRADVNLTNSLLIAGLAFLSLAVPLYFAVRATSAVWAVEAVALAGLGLRYRSTLTQAAAGAVITLALGNLAFHLPLHTGPFRLFFNTAFGAWAFVAATLLAGHILYRTAKHLDVDVRQMATQTLYAAGLLVLLTALGMELWLHHFNVKGLHPNMGFFGPQMTLVFALFLLLFAARPLRPQGPLCPIVAAAFGTVASFFLVFAYPQFHRGAFTSFANFDFVRALALVVALFAAAWLLYRAGTKQEEEWAASAVLALGGVLLLGVLMTEEIWFQYARQGRSAWRPQAHMYISVMWALYASVLMVVGFWRRVRVLRYIALGIFVLLLAKIFLIDTRTLETAYRIAGFLATGLALVGISYLYQYLKKTGFFEAIR